MSIGEKILELRTQLGMTQEELAHKMGYSSRSTINKIEMNKVDVSMAKVVAFATVLNTSPAYLMGWLDEDNKMMIAAQGKILLDTFNTLNNEGRAELLQYAEFLSSKTAFTK